MSADQHRTAYVVDDDDAVRDSFRVLLSHRGYVVSAFASASEFLAFARSETQSCLLLDIRMPNMDGMALLRALKQQGARLPIIMITGHGDLATAARALRDGAFDFLEKPFTQDIILECLDRAFAAPNGDLEPTAFARRMAERIASLSGRERQLLRYLLDGDKAAQIAARLGVEPREVALERSILMRKMEAQTMSALFRMAIAAESSLPNQSQ